MTDFELVELMKKGDPKGLSVTYETFRSEFIRWIVKLHRCSNEGAREFYQASILILYENIQTGKLDQLKTSLKTYLFAIGKNLVWQEYRMNKKLNGARAENYLEHYLVPDDEEDTTEKKLELVRECFQKLGDPCHLLLDMFYFGQKDMDEISSAMGYKNPDTAKNQKYKCMERLRKMVEDLRQQKPVEQ